MRRSTRFMGVAGGLAAIAIVVAGCSSGTSSSSDGSSKPINYVAALPMSGSYSSLGKAEQAALKASVDVVNKDGGILGRKVQLKVLDDQNDPATTVSVLQSALASNKPDLVYPGASSIDVVPALPVVSAAGVVSIHSSTSPTANDPSKYPLAFGVHTAAEAISGSVVDWLKEKGYTKVAALYDNTASGVPVANAFQTAAKAAGIQVTKLIMLDSTSLDATAELTTLQATQPQALVIGAVNGPLGQAILKNRATIGWDVPTVADVNSATVQGTTAPTASSGYDNVFIQSFKYGVQGSDVQKTDAFTTFQKALDVYAPTKPDWALVAYAVGYEPLMLYKAAVEKAKSTDPQKVGKAMLELKDASDVPGWYMTNSIDYSSTSHLPAYASADFDIHPIGYRDPVTGSDVPGTD